LNKDRVPHFSGDCSSDVTFAVQVLQQQHFARADDAAFTVAGRDLHRSIKIDDELAAGGLCQSLNSRWASRGR
jgi:hypothetical protein